MADEEILRCAQDDRVKHLRGMRITADLSTLGGCSAILIRQGSLVKKSP